MVDPSVTWIFWLLEETMIIHSSMQMSDPYIFFPPCNYCLLFSSSLFILSSQIIVQTVGELEKGFRGRG